MSCFEGKSNLPFRRQISTTVQLSFVFGAFIIAGLFSSISFIDEVEKRQSGPY